MTAVPTAAHEDEVKRAAELKEWLESRISELESELGHLKDMMAIVDSTLRKSSFVPAAILRSASEATSGGAIISESRKTDRQNSEAPASSNATEIPDGQRALRRSKDAKLLANAFVDAQKIVIVPESGMKFSQVTPPFQSFFVNRILKGYRAKDEEQSKNGSLAPDQILSYIIQETEGNISSITITNYRDRVRLNEILSTATWAFTRMLEKK
jgi:hypothetical protein